LSCVGEKELGGPREANHTERGGERRGEKEMKLNSGERGKKKN